MPDVFFFSTKKKWSHPASVRAHRRHFRNGTLPRDGGPTDGHNNNKPRILPERGPPTWHQHRTTANKHRYPRRGPWCDHSLPSEKSFFENVQRSIFDIFCEAWCVAWRCKNAVLHLYLQCLVAIGLFAKKTKPIKQLSPKCGRFSREGWRHHFFVDFSGFGHQFWEGVGYQNQKKQFPERLEKTFQKKSRK